MTALLFIAAFALLLGIAQLLGWTADSRDSRDWRPAPAGSRRGSRSIG